MSRFPRPLLWSSTPSTITPIPGVSDRTAVVLPSTHALGGALVAPGTAQPVQPAGPGIGGHVGVPAYRNVGGQHFVGDAWTGSNDTGHVTNDPTAHSPGATANGPVHTFQPGVVRTPLAGTPGTAFTNDLYDAPYELPKPNAATSWEATEPAAISRRVYLPPDQARPSRMPSASSTLIRDWDGSWQAPHLLGVHAEVRHGRTPGADLAAFWGGPGKIASRRNTFRTQPGHWDENLVDSNAV